MAVYAIGDLHGCFEELKALLRKIAFNPKNDKLWFVGDLLSRGPDSLGCLRFIRNLGDRAVATMGNHEVRAILGLSGNYDKDFSAYMTFFNDIPDRDELYKWLRSLPLVHQDPELGITMIHAGLPPNWTIADAVVRSNKLAKIFADHEQTKKFLAHPLPKPTNNEPDHDDEIPWLKFALATLTRIRYCTKDGVLISPKEVRTSGLLDKTGHPPKDSPYQAWHQHRSWQPNEKIVYGHWAMAGLTIGHHSLGIDSGAVYGGKLTAIQLDHPEHPITQVDSGTYLVM
ncbi:MAG: symmetrical bis(5'-nucleosyl)-tetraphosphatase [Magnetococcales bacterium]|nr:symmetrical bis(5'-nucleosyl)-tetraphosphatase [Magnetococcales bacterium]